MTSKEWQETHFPQQRVNVKATVATMQMHNYTNSTPQSQAIAFTSLYPRDTTTGQHNTNCTYEEQHVAKRTIATQAWTVNAPLPTSQTQIPPGKDSQIATRNRTNVDRPSTCPEGNLIDLADNTTLHQHNLNTNSGNQSQSQGLWWTSDMPKKPGSGIYKQNPPQSSGGIPPQSMQMMQESEHNTSSQMTSVKTLVSPNITPDGQLPLTKYTNTIPSNAVSGVHDATRQKYGNQQKTPAHQTGKALATVNTSTIAGNVVSEGKQATTPLSETARMRGHTESWEHKKSSEESENKSTPSGTAIHQGGNKQDFQFKAEGTAQQLICDLQKQNRSLEEAQKKLQSKVNALTAENKDLSDRLSKEMNDKMSKDETSVENVSIKNRPMNIADEYKLFGTDEWLAAKQYLDEYHKGKVPDGKMFDFLLTIIMTAAEQATAVHNFVQDKIYDVIRDPLGREDKGEGAKPKMVQTTEVKIPVSLQNAVGDHLRSSKSDHFVNRIQMATISALKHNNPSAKELLKQSAIVQFVAKISEITWKMTIQRPKLEFQTPGVNEPHKELIQEPFWGSDDPKLPQSRVQMYVLPVMYHGNHVMVKGTVLIKAMK